MSIKQVFESITHAPYYQVKEVTYECARGLALVNKRKTLHAFIRIICRAMRKEKCLKFLQNPCRKQESD